MEHPYYIIPLIEKLKSLPKEGADDERAKLEMLISVNIGAPDILADILGHTPEPFDDFYNDRYSPTPDLGDSINRFLSDFGNQGMTSANTAIPDEIPIVPAVDYVSTYLEPKPLLGDESRTPGEAPRPEKAEKSPEPAPLTESLVKILVKNGKYEEALKIIRELNLKNPEKSIYFADQMRFLRKVLLSKQKTRPEN